MKILYYDCFSGISGDMNLGALIDLGVDKEYLISELNKLNLKGYKIKIKKDMKLGIEGTRVEVILEEDGHHIHRNLKDIEHIINESALGDNVKDLSLEMFNAVAKAEAKVHGKDLYEVHFHEVGAVDSIVDIAGAAICLDYLKVDKILSSRVELGGGFVKCAHGTIPVPAPATVEILKGAKVKLGAVPFETTTPTGAAILAANVSEFTDKKEFKIDKIGYGLGKRDTEIPNVLRVFLGEDNKNLYNDVQWIMECNIDDMSGEIYDYVMEKLFEEGALDVYFTPIIMKKGRPAVKITVLYKKEIEKNIEKVLFKETTTLGVRKYMVDKVMLKREIEDIDTPYGRVQLKVSYYNGEKIKSKVEFDHLKTIARDNNIPLIEVARIIED